MAATYQQEDHVVRVVVDENASATTGMLERKSGDTEAGERQSWSKKREYVLTLMGYIIGIGNVWRFPYMCNRNGGGAFLLPFLLCLTTMGFPLFFLEAALGQFASRGPLQVWNVCPLVKGVGIAMLILSIINFWYFNLILSWGLYYLGSSFHAVLPWSRCDQWWNTPHCTDYSRPRNVSMTSDNMTSSADNVTVMSGRSGNDSWWQLQPWLNGSVVGNVTEGNSSGPLTSKVVTAAEEFWQHNVLRASGGIDEPGHVVWPLMAAQCGVLLFIFLALLKGIRSSGKVVYVTATAPYFLLTVLLIRGATLPGAGAGVLYYLTPDFARLLEPKVWVEAALQVFYSLGPGWGGIVALSSYNKFHNNCLRDAVVLSFLGEGTSIFGGFAIFSVLGYMSHMAGVPIDKVVSAGPGLAFIAYPEAISMMPLPQLWAVLFFLMLFTLTIDNQLASGETVVTVICDSFPRIVGHRRTLLTALLCVVALLTSVSLVTQGGVYVFQLFDWFIATYTLTSVALIETIVLSWVYGVDRFGDDIQMMLGRKPPVFIKLLWCFVLPVLLVVLLVFTLARYEGPSYGDYHYSTGAIVLGWAVASVSFVPIPVYVIVQLFMASGSFTERLRQTTRPNNNWGPADPTRRDLYRKQVMQRPPRQSWLDIIR